MTLLPMLALSVVLCGQILATTAAAAAEQDAFGLASVDDVGLVALLQQGQIRTPRKPLEHARHIGVPPGAVRGSVGAELTLSSLEVPDQWVGLATEVSPWATWIFGGDDVPVNVPDGVVCPTWLHQEIQRDNLKPFLKRAGVSPDGFVQETSRLCGGSAGPKAGSYTGSWKDSDPKENDLRILRGLVYWIRRQKEKHAAKSMTWHNFSKPDKGSSVGKIARHAASHPTAITPSGPPRVLDLGCGSGEDILAVKKELGAKTEDTLCLDISEVKAPGLTSIVLDASSDDAYKKSLDKALVGREHSVHVAVSVVTFHHILGEKRRAAFAFLANILTPGGIFLLADWDNSLVPSRWIEFDLVHILPGMLFGDGRVPADPAALNIGTEYLSVDAWLAEAGRAGLIYDGARSRIMQGRDHLLTPQELANETGSANRDFWAVFGISASSDSAWAVW